MLPAAAALKTPRLQPASLSYSNSGGSFFSLNYNYGTQNNGQIQSITDTKDSTKPTTYTYDAWARLKTASNAQWGLSWVYDRFGNRTTQTVTAGSGPPNALTIDKNTNRIVGAGYDAAGNMTNDNVNTLAYDAESKLVSNLSNGVTTTYSLDGNGLRVKKAVQNGITTVYIFSGSKVIAEYDNGAAISAPSREYIYAGAQLVAKMEGGITNYFHPDHLSTRAITDSLGNVAGTRGHYPFGETWYETSTTTKWKYASYERDNESGNDYAMARTYINRYGRFNTIDPLSGSVSNPQSLDRYAYVLNDHGGNGINAGGGGGGNSSGGFFSGFLQRTKTVNHCAGQLSQVGSVSNLSGGRVPEVLGSNTFGDIASLATGSGGFDQGAALAADATAHAVPSIATQVAVGTVTSIGKAISHTPVVYNPVTVSTTTVTVAMTTVSKVILGAAEGLRTANVLLDAGVYIGALVVCSQP